MHRPRAVLEQWVKDGRLSVGEATSAPPREPENPVAMQILPENLPDADLFQLAMKEVKALGWSDVPLHHRPPLEIQPQDDELEALRALEDCMRWGNIEIEQTAAYIEGSVQPHGRLYLDDLRSGRFSVQTYLDLHGMNQQEARCALDEFLMESVRLGLSCVRVIHGRGRHSHKHHPILKENIQRWLSSRRMGRHARFRSAVSVQLLESQAGCGGSKSFPVETQPFGKQNLLQLLLLVEAEFHPEPRRVGEQMIGKS